MNYCKTNSDALKRHVSLPGCDIPIQFVLFFLYATFMMTNIRSVAYADPLLSVAPLEAERDHPDTIGHLPPFPREPGTARFVIARHAKPPSDPTTVVYMRIPEQFVGGDTKEPRQVWGLNLLIKYPDMTGPRNPDNLGKMGTCAGGCPGDMLVSIYNNIGKDPYGAQLRWELLENDMRSPNPYRKYLRVPSQIFPVHVKVIYGENEKNVSNKDYFVSMDDSGKVEVFAECSTNTARHLCIMSASSLRFPGVEIQYNIFIDSVDKWRSIQKNVVQFVDGMIVGVFTVNNPTNNQHP